MALGNETLFARRFLTLRGRRRARLVIDQWKSGPSYLYPILHAGRDTKCSPNFLAAFDMAIAQLLFSQGSCDISILRLAFAASNGRAKHICPYGQVYGREACPITVLQRPLLDIAMSLT